MKNVYFQVMAKPVGPLCNLDCTYCYYTEKTNLFPANAKYLMSGEILETFIKEKIRLETSDTVLFIWQGGEPTIAGVDYFRKISALQKKYSAGKNIQNAFQTNGILIDDEWCTFFRDNNYLIGISIDGPEQLHNQFRKDKAQNPTFKKVMKGIETLIKNNIEFNTLTCVQKINSYYPLEVYEFLKDTGSRFIQFIPIVERIQDYDNTSFTGQGDEVTGWSVEPLQFGVFLKTVFDEWIRNDVGSIFVQVFENSLQSWLNMESTICVFGELCGNALIIEHNGDVYSCDHFVYPEFKLGNIMETPLDKLFYSEKQKIFGKDKRDKLPRYCKECSFLFACNGECTKHRFLLTPGGETGLNYLCEGYKYFFDSINVYMNAMTELYKKNIPSDYIMNWVKEKDNGFPTIKPARNDECPCGSGKKYKNCCSR